ncbi:MAG: hypothetical protein NTY37_10835 [Methanothrix sp.]|nr:hypothetical protein [Methanothrix sp.]
MVVKQDFRQGRHLASKDLHYMDTLNSRGYDKDIKIYPDELGGFIQPYYYTYHPYQRVRKTPILNQEYPNLPRHWPEDNESTIRELKEMITELESNAPSDATGKKQQHPDKKGWLLKMYRSSIIGAVTGVLIGGMFGGLVGAVLGGIAGILIGISSEETERRNEGWDI